MPKSTFVEIPPEEQAQMLAALRRARYGYLLALHILLLCAVGRNPTEIAAVLFCSRSSVYRTVRAYRAGTLGLEHDAQGRLMPTRAHHGAAPDAAPVAAGPAQGAPRAYGWCRTRWSCATLALTLQAKRGHHGLGRDDAPLGARARLGVEAGQAGGQRRRPAPGGALGPHPLRLRAVAAVGGHGVCGRTRYPSAAQSGLCLDAQRHPAGGHDAGPESRSTTWPGPWIWPLGRCTTAWGRAKPTRCSGTCSAASRHAIQRPRTRGSMWWWITIRSIRPRPSSNGWPPTHG